LQQQMQSFFLSGTKEAEQQSPQDSTVVLNGGVGRRAAGIQGLPNLRVIAVDPWG
jgi:hypothetical protein